MEIKIKKIAIIGANEFQKKLVEKAKNLGIETHVFAWEEGAVAKDSSDYFYDISVTEKEKILEILSKSNIDGICSIASDIAMPTVNYLAQELNLIGNSINCTELTTNKYAMREKLKKSGLPIPKYQLVEEISEIDFDYFSFPVIVKPIDRSGSRGIFKVLNIDELNVAIMDAKKVSFTNKLLIEEYIEGNEFSIEALTQNGVHKILQITEKFTSGAPNFIEHAHLSPARISKDTKIKVLEIIQESLNSLNVRNGASHSEIKISSTGEIKIIEIAARMGGDFIGSDMVEISTGFDYVGNTIKVAMGQEVEYIFRKSKDNAIVKFIFNENDIRKILEIKRKYPKVIKEFFVKPEVTKVNDSASRNGYCILKIDETNSLIDILEIFDMYKKNKE